MSVEDWFTQQSADIHRPEQVTNDDEFPLILACRQGRQDIVQWMIENHVPLDSVDTFGNNALWAACYAESEACIRLLARNGLEIDFVNPAGNSVLAYAASSGKDTMVALLLELGANCCLQNQDGMNALDLAVTRPTFKLLRAATARC